MIAISHFIAEDIAQRYRFDVNKLRVIQRGVDLNMFDPDRVSAARMIKFTNEWRLPDASDRLWLCKLPAIPLG